MLSTVATVALVVAGAGASTVWFLSVLRKLGLRLRFAPPESPVLVYPSLNRPYCSAPS